MLQAGGAVLAVGADAPWQAPVAPGGDKLRQGGRSPATAAGSTEGSTGNQKGTPTAWPRMLSLPGRREMPSPTHGTEKRLNVSSPFPKPREGQTVQCLATEDPFKRQSVFSWVFLIQPGAVEQPPPCQQTLGQSRVTWGTSVKESVPLTPTVRQRSLRKSRQRQQHQLRRTGQRTG